jgi:hypothetical protein
MYVDVAELSLSSSPIPNQLNVLNARPGVVEASLRVEPYNGEFFILAYSPVAHLTFHK